MGNEQTDSPTSIEDMTSFIEDHARVVLSLHPEALTPDHSDFQASQQKVRTFMSDFFDHWLPTGEDRYCIAIFNMRDFKRRHDQARQSDQRDNGSNVGDPTRDFVLNVPSDKKGPCMSSKNITLTLFTPQSEYFYKTLNKDEFTDYVDNGVPEAVYEGLCDDAYYCEPIFSDDATLSVDDQEVAGFTNLITSAYERFVTGIDTSAPQPPRNFALVHSRWYKRAWYELEIDQPFDMTKLSVSFSKYDHPDGRYEITYSLMYDGRDFEFDFSHDWNADSEYIIDDQGNSFDFSLRDSEEV
jgi:hypothetical protein